MDHQNTAKIKKTVLFAPIDAQGHINPLKGVANHLKKRGHRTVFLFQDPVDSGLLKDGHEVYDCTSEGLVISDVNAARDSKKYDKIFAQMDDMMKDPGIEKQCNWSKATSEYMIQLIKLKEPIYERKLELINPDVIIIDQFRVQPAILKCGKPWAQLFSPSPLYLHPPEHNLPTGFLGIPTKFKEIEDESLRSKYQSMIDKYLSTTKESLAQWKQYLADEHGYRSHPKSPIELSTHLSIYMYPKELDYELPLEHWTQCDSLLRNNCEVDFDTQGNAQQQPQNVFQVPLELRDKPGKLIFLSMGTLACNNVGLMKRLVETLSKSPHRFIVSRGPKCDEYELGFNMWGKPHLDQLAILPKIDLIITHGGNNTITECFYYGVPGFIVCPVFGDQKDNAQRIEECKLGRKINIYLDSEEQVLQAIEDVLNDATIKPRMAAIRNRMQTPESKFKALRLFRDFVER